VRPEPLGSQAPQALFQKDPPPETRAGVSHVATLVTAAGARPKVPDD
jgi:hypothetical protein